jgi:hypothetical protein
MLTAGWLPVDQDDRALAKTGLIGRPKAKALRQLAESRGWLDPAHPGRKMPSWRWRSVHCPSVRSPCPASTRIASR